MYRIRSALEIDWMLQIYVRYMYIYIYMSLNDTVHCAVTTDGGMLAVSLALCLLSERCHVCIVTVRKTEKVTLTIHIYIYVHLLSIKVNYMIHESKTLCYSH